MRISRLLLSWEAWSLWGKTQREESASWRVTQPWRVERGRRRHASRREDGLWWGREASGAWKRRRKCSRSGRTPPLEQWNPTISETVNSGAETTLKNCVLRRQNGLFSSMLCGKKESKRKINKKYKYYYVLICLLTGWIRICKGTRYPITLSRVRVGWYNVHYKKKINSQI